MKTKLFTLLFAMLVSVAAIAADKNVTKVFNVEPVLTCNSCEQKVKETVRFVSGVKDVQANHKDNTVTITYNPEKFKCENLQVAMAKIGRKLIPVDGSCGNKAKACEKAAKTCEKNGKACTKAAKTCEKTGKACSKK